MFINHNATNLHKTVKPTKAVETKDYLQTVNLRNPIYHPIISAAITTPVSVTLYSVHGASDGNGEKGGELNLA